jgi:hypothetical protein
MPNSGNRPPNTHSLRATATGSAPTVGSLILDQQHRTMLLEHCGQCSEFRHRPTKRYPEDVVRVIQRDDMMLTNLDADGGSDAP